MSDSSMLHTAPQARAKAAKSISDEQKEAALRHFPENGFTNALITELAAEPTLQRMIEHYADVMKCRPNGNPLPGDADAVKFMRYIAQSQDIGIMAFNNLINTALNNRDVAHHHR